MRKERRSVAVPASAGNGAGVGVVDLDHVVVSFEPFTGTVHIQHRPIVGSGTFLTWVDQTQGTDVSGNIAGDGVNRKDFILTSVLSTCVLYEIRVVTTAPVSGITSALVLGTTLDA